MNVRERPIIFSAPMVCALLEGRKTQTRRIVKHVPLHAMDAAWVTCHCPYGKIGDRLWVRETWQGPIWDTEECPDNPHQTKYVAYRASGHGDDDLIETWRPPIFMPRWASRITLEVTDVRVQGLQEISEEDALAEGADIELLPLPPVPLSSAMAKKPTIYSGSRDIFAHLWESINGKRAPWDSNPFVWAITFKRVQP